MDMCGMEIRDVVEVDGDIVDVIWSAEVAIRQCLHASTSLLKRNYLSGFCTLYVLSKRLLI